MRGKDTTNCQKLRRQPSSMYCMYRVRDEVSQGAITVDQSFSFECAIMPAVHDQFQCPMHVCDFPTHGRRIVDWPRS